MNDLAVLCLQHGLERLLPYLPSLACPSIRLMETEASDVIGLCHLGGLPDANRDFVWPRLRDCFGQLSPQQAASLNLDTPLIFLGQLNWEQLKPYDLENVLPLAGGALFFAGTNEAAGTYFVTAIKNFAPQHIPLPNDLRYVLPRRSLRPHFEWTLPDYALHGTIGGGDFQRCFFDTFHSELEFLELSSVERKAYDAFRAQVTQPGSHRHRVLGHADYEQNPAQLDLERQARGLLDYDNYLTLCDPHSPLTRQLKRQALESNWRLVFQIAHFVSHQGLWSDVGTHYFWSKQNDMGATAPRFVGDAQIG